MDDILELAEKAHHIGVKLEIIGGLPVWEAFPNWQHQRSVDRVRTSMREAIPKPDQNAKPCACLHAADIYIRFPDGSLKRPDIAIFCQEPPIHEQKTATTLIPEAVVEVVSAGYEAKDLELSPKFYLLHGVKDVIVFDPETLLVLHERKDGAKRMVSPVMITLECGCSLVV